MKSLLALLGSVFLLAAAGCETALSSSGGASKRIDYGAYPENYEQIIKEHFAKTLHEPSAAQFRMGKPFAGYIKAGPLFGGKIEEAGYLVEVWLKAKDRSGAYLAERRLGALLKNGDVLMELTSSELDAAVKAP